MDEHQSETDGQTAEFAVGVAAVGDAEDDHQEHEGQQSFNEEGTAGGDGLVARVGTAASLLEGLAKTVGSEHASRTSASGFPNDEQQSTSDDTADELGNPVAKHLFKRHATIGPNAKADGGIQVGTRNVTNAVGHGHHSQTESDGYAKETNVSEKSGTATTEHQNECAEQFGEELVANLHNTLNFNWLIIRFDLFSILCHQAFRF